MYCINNVKKNITVNNSSIIDECNKITCILSDKTGTITEGKLELVQLVGLDEDTKNIVDNLINDNSENKLITAVKYCINKNLDNVCLTDEDTVLFNFCEMNEKLNNFTVVPLNNLKFTFERKRSSVVVKKNSQNRDNDKLIIFTKGSVESIRNVCYNREDLDKIVKYLDNTYPHYRLLAYGYREFFVKELDNYVDDQNYQKLEYDLEFVGVVCLVDKLQNNIHEFINICKEKKIKFNICTGDRLVTSIKLEKN